MAKDKYPHFNPEKHKIESKIATVRKGHHCKYNINYHIIWIPKFRKPILKDKVKDVFESIIKGQCCNLRLDCLALEIMPNHLHLFVGARPTHRPFEIVKQLKGNTSIQLRRCFPHLKYLYKKKVKKFKNLWARGYYCGSAGHVSQEQVRRYIQEQMGKDVFDYYIFGDVTKQFTIGDFTG